MKLFLDTADINEIRVAAERAIALTDKLRRPPIASQTESPASEP